MSQVMDEEIKRWTARRKSALVLEIHNHHLHVQGYNPDVIDIKI